MKKSKEQLDMYYVLMKECILSYSDIDNMSDAERLVLYNLIKKSK